MKTQPIPKGYDALTPYITVRGAEKAIEFYKKAFSAKEVGRITMADGPFWTQIDYNEPY
jgi:PhnB protein